MGPQNQKLKKDWRAINSKKKRSMIFQLTFYLENALLLWFFFCCCCFVCSIEMICTESQQKKITQNCKCWQPSSDEIKLITFTLKKKNPIFPIQKIQRIRIFKISLQDNWKVSTLNALFTLLITEIYPVLRPAHTFRWNLLLFNYEMQWSGTLRIFCVNGNFHSSGWATKVYKGQRFANQLY